MTQRKILMPKKRGTVPIRVIRKAVKAANKKPAGKAFKFVEIGGLQESVFCPRGLETCMSLNQIISSSHESFICCGQNDGAERSIEQDAFTVCFKNSDIDSREHWDKRDITQTASVLLGALAIIEEKDSDEYHEAVA